MRRERCCLILYCSERELLNYFVSHLKKKKNVANVPKLVSLDDDTYDIRIIFITVKMTPFKYRSMLMMR